jgi:hypothetical protein
MILAVIPPPPPHLALLYSPNKLAPTEENGPTVDTQTKLEPSIPVSEIKVIFCQAGA